MDKLIEQEAVGEVIKDTGGCKIAGDMNNTRKNAFPMQCELQKEK